jgi:hypothetical protein
MTHEGELEEIWKEVIIAWVKYYPGIFVEVVREVMKI